MGCRQKGPRDGLVHPFGLCFFPWPWVSEGAFCHKLQVKFIWCGINALPSTWNHRKRIWVGTHIAFLCSCRVRFPTWFLSLTNNVDNQFWLVFSTTLQYPNFYHSVISIFDGRRWIVKIDSTKENEMKIETSMTSQVGKNSRSYFQCVHHRLVPQKHPHRHCHNSKLNSWYWQLGYILDAGMVSHFFCFFRFFVPGTHFYTKQTNSRPYFQCVHHRLVPKKHPHRHCLNSKLNSWYCQLGYVPDTGMVSVFLLFFLFVVPGTHFYRKQTKYTANQVPSLAWYQDCSSWLNKSTWQVITCQVIWRGVRGQGDKSTCQVNLSSWLVCQMEVVTASRICHSRKKFRQFVFENRYRVGEGVCEIFRSFFCVL